MENDVKRLNDQDIADITAAANTAIALAKDAKCWYKSKTLKANAVIIIAIIAQAVTGQVVIDAELQGVIISVINIGLRFITKHPIA